jgi:hypothetical protein
MKRKLLEEIGDTGRKTTNKSKENRKKLEKYENSYILHESETNPSQV